MKEWLATSPFSSILNIIIVVVLVILAFNLLKSIAKPLLTTILVVGIVLVAFNVIDLAFIASTGEKMLAHLWELITSSAKEAAADAISSALSGTDLPSLK